MALQRHVNLDIYLITQTKKQLNTVFHDFGDYVISAISATERVLPSVFEYRYYSHVDNLGKPSEAFKSEKLIAKPEIFDWYTSGASNSGHDGFRKKLKFIIGGLIVVLLFVIYQFNSLFTVGKHSKKNVPEQIEAIKKRDTKLQASMSLIKKRYLKLTCIGAICKNYKFGVVVNIRDLKYLLKDTDSRLLRQPTISSHLSLSEVYLLVSPSFLGLFQHGSEQHGKKNNSITN